MKKNKQVFIYDIETYRELFVICFINIKTKEEISFEISRRTNQLNEAIKFLKEDVLLLIGFNNLGFDYPILHRMLLLKKTVPEFYHNLAEKIIGTDKQYFKVFLIPQIDLYKIWHLDNMAVWPL